MVREQKRNENLISKISRENSTQKYRKEDS